MKLMYNGKQIADIMTNHSMDVKQALYCHGYDLDDQDDANKAYKVKEPFAYVDDDGICCVDYDGLSIEG